MTYRIRYRKKYIVQHLLFLYPWYHDSDINTCHTAYSAPNIAMALPNAVR